MPSNANTSNHVKSASINDDSDDISLTFWIFLWSFLAIAATWIYTKLNSRGPEVISEEDTNDLHGQRADEQIARKLVKEISKNDLVKRSTFRRQRSYEIIDGEVRIYYDVAYGYEEPLSAQEKAKYGENIIDNAEVDNFPIRRNSMDDLELIFPGRLPGIIEEGEEELDDECKEIKVQVPVISYETCQTSKEDESNLAVVKIVDHDRDSGDNFGMKQRDSACVQSNFVKVTMSPETEQTNIAGSEEDGRDGYENTRAFPGNSDNSSSDEISSGSQESIIENVQNVSRLDDKDLAVHASNSTQTFVYKLTEVTASNGGSFTVTKKEIRKENNIGEKTTTATECLQTQSSPSYTTQEPAECLKYAKQLDKRLPQSCEAMKADNICQDETNIHSNLNNGSVLISSYNNEQDMKTVSEQHIQTNITKEAGNVQVNLHEEDVPQKCLILHRKLYNNTSLHQVIGKEDESEVENLDSQHDGIFNGEIEYNISENVPLTKNHEEGSYKFSPLEDGSDILIDNSGDFLFKVIGPSEVGVLEDIDEADEYLVAENVREQLSIDENSNYKSIDYCKSWKSLPSWEETQHLYHGEFNRDGNVFDVESNEENIIKTEDTIPLMNETILDGNHLECAEVNKGTCELHVDIQAVADSTEHVGMAFACRIPKTSEVILTETAENITESDPILVNNINLQESVQFASKEIPNTIQGAAKEGMTKDPEHVLVSKRVENVKVHPSNISENDQVMADMNMKKCVEAASMELDDAKIIDTSQVNRSMSCESATGLMGSDDKDSNEEIIVALSANNEKVPSNISECDKDSDEEIIVACLSANNEKVPGTKVIYATHPSNISECDHEDSDEEIIVALSSNNDRVPGTKVIYASGVAEEKMSKPSYHCAQVLSHENYETKTFQETSLDNVPLPSSPVMHKAVFDQGTDVDNVPLPSSPVMHEAVFDQGTDVDNVSDVDEIDIEPEEKYKSKSVTDLDQALASCSGSEYNTSGGMTDNDTSGLSKSVPDILDCYREESFKEAAAARTNSNNSIESLTENLPKKNLSLSTPEIGALQSNTGLKKVTKIKIVHVKFLEMEDESGSENIEEFFTIEGDVPMSGKMKRRSVNFTDVSSLATGEPLNQVDECFTAENVQQKQFAFGFDEHFKDLPLSTSSTQTISSATAQSQPSSLVLPERSRSSTESLPEKERYIAKYGDIPSQSSRAKIQTGSQGMKLSEKFQMPQDATQHNKKSSSYQSKTEFKHNNENEISKTDSHLVRVKSGVINNYECSSDADSEMSYNTPSPRPRTRKTHRVLVHNNSIDSASSSDADSPRRRGRTRNEKPTMSQIFGIQSDNIQDLKPVKEKIFERNPKLFSRFGHLQDSQIERESYSRQQELITQRSMSPTYQMNETMFDGVIQSGPNRSMEFNPIADIDGYHGFEPFERNQSPTSISSDQSSVFSFNCDFEPLPSPTSSFNPEVYTCDNPMCMKQDILLGQEKTCYKSCPACFTYYCSSECRKLHWPAHKQNCYFGRVNTYVRSIIRLCQRRQDLNMYLSQLARDGYNKKGRGVVMATFNSPELAREFITKGYDAFSGRKPTYSSLSELNHEGVISKHRVALMQAVRDYEPNEEFVFNIAVVAVHDVPVKPVPRYKLNTILHCIKMPLNEKIVAHQPKEYGKVETRLFALPKCARHEFVNEMEARRHYCRNLSKNLRQYNIRLKEDYQECYKKLCMYVEHDIAFEPMTVYGQRSGLTYKCILAPEQTYPLNAEYC